MTAHLNGIANVLATDLKEIKKEVGKVRSEFVDQRNFQQHRERDCEICFKRLSWH